MELVCKSVFPNNCAVRRVKITDSFSEMNEIICARSSPDNLNSHFSLAFTTSASFEMSVPKKADVYSASNPMSLIYVIAMKAPEFIDLVSFDSFFITTVAYCFMVLPLFTSSAALLMGGSVLFWISLDLKSRLQGTWK